MQDTTPATLPTARRLSTFGCLTTQPWHNPEGPCRDGSSRLARLHTFYPARDSGPEPVNVYGTGKVLGHNRGSRRAPPPGPPAVGRAAPTPPAVAAPPDPTGAPPPTAMRSATNTPAPAVPTPTPVATAVPDPAADSFAPRGVTQNVSGAINAR